MKRLFLFLVLFLTTTICQAQRDFSGIYYQEGFQLDLRANHVCIMRNIPFCATGGIPLPDTSTWNSIEDTITIKIQNIDIKTYVFIEGKLFNLHYSDTLVEYYGLPRGHYFISYPALEKVNEYYENGDIESKISKYKEKKIVTIFYHNGKIKELRQYINEVMSGDWFEFDEWGNIRKITTYKNGKTKKS